MIQKLHRVLKCLLVKTPMPAAEITAEYQKQFGSGYVHSQTLRWLQLDGYLEQQARKGKCALWHLSDKGRQAALLDLPPVEPPPPPKNEWQKLCGSGQALLRELGKGRPVYKRARQSTCMEKPIEPKEWNQGLTQLWKLDLVDRVAGNLTRDSGPTGRLGWIGDWGRFVINDKGKEVLALAPPSKDRR